MKKIVILIDFDNYFGNDMKLLTAEDLEFAFSELTNICDKEYNEFDTISIRLYGGWFNEMSLTKQASILQQLLYNINVFPKVQKGKAIQGSIEMVSALNGIPAFTWGYTYKETNGIKNVRIDFDKFDELCDKNRENCPKFILYKFTKSKYKICRVEGCNNIQKDIFKGIEQKMVDTLIACDILSFADELTTKGILVVSDDQDHFPSMALAVEQQKAKQSRNLDNLILGIRNEKKFEFISEFLKPFQIKTILIS
jgi:hypothetical protein